MRRQGPRLGPGPGLRAGLDFFAIALTSALALFLVLALAQFPRRSGQLVCVMVDTQPMIKPALFSLALALSLFPPVAMASPRDDLVGYWKLRRGVGGPCGSQIESLTYYFGRDGNYRAEARMLSGGEFKAAGTYTATDTSATARVDGTIVGPYPYSITNNILTVDHPQFGCKILLDREDY